MTMMYDPPHPGLSIKLECLEPLGLSVTKGAEILGVTRKTLSSVINGRAGISPEMAIRLSKAFGSSPETWYGMQVDHDLWQAKQLADKIDVERYEPA